MNSIEQMKLFMEPKSIAVIGVPRRTGKDAMNILENLLAMGFGGKIYPVNPNADELLGVKVYHSILDVPEEVDLAVIVTPRPPVLDLTKECLERGIKAIVIVAQGFADAGEEGKKLQDEIVRLARKHGARIMGPNSLGISNPSLNLSTAFRMTSLQKAPLGVVSQTGLLFPGLNEFLKGKGIDIANACDIEFPESLEYFEADPDVKVIALHIEGIRDWRRFKEVATRVSAKKPIIAFKLGKGEMAAKAVMSHTGSLIGKTEVYEALFKQCGVISVQSLEEFYDAARTFIHLPLFNGNRIGVITVTGAGGVMAADTCETHNLKLAQLSQKTLKVIEEISPPWLGVGNPIDIWPLMQITKRSYGEVIGKILPAVVSDPGVDGILIIGPAFSMAEVDQTVETISEVGSHSKGKPITCWFAGASPKEVQDRIGETEGFAVFDSPERAVKALARLREYAEILERKR